MTDTVKTTTPSDYPGAAASARAMLGRISGHLPRVDQPSGATVASNVAVAESILALAAAVHETRPPEATPADEPEAGDPPVTMSFRGYSGRAGRTGPVQRDVHVDHAHWEGLDASGGSGPVEEAVEGQVRVTFVPAVGTLLILADLNAAPPKSKVRSTWGGVWKKRRSGDWRLCRPRGQSQLSLASELLFARTSGLLLVRWGGKP